MAEVRPFRGIRYEPSRVGSLADVVCAPYDIITPAAQADYYARSDHNVVRLELGRDEPGDDADHNRYTRAAAQLDAWLRAGVLRRDPAPALYAYEEGFAVAGALRRRRGFFAVVRLEEWERRVVLPHERTLPKPKSDRLSLLRACRTNLSPVFGLYDDPAGRVAAVLEAATRAEPTVRLALAPGAVAAAAAEHRLWPIVAPAATAEVERALAESPIYIADGHHRYETALEHWREARAAGAGPDDPAAFAMVLLVDSADPGLVVLPTHRLVRAPGLDRAALLRKLGELFDVEELPLGVDDALPALLAELARRGDSAHVFGVAGLAPGLLHVLRAGPELERRLPLDRTAEWRSLDVAALQSLVIEGLLWPEGPEAAGGGLGYTRDAAEALAGIVAGAHDLAFFLNPPRPAQIRAIALAGDRMPEKSTYFWPKPPTGLVCYAHASP